MAYIIYSLVLMGIKAREFRFENIGATLQLFHLTMISELTPNNGTIGKLWD